MNEKCHCGGVFTHGSALYDYYSCGHAIQKPLNAREKEEQVVVFSPYEPFKSRYLIKPLKKGVM